PCSVRLAANVASPPVLLKPPAKLPGYVLAAPDGDVSVQPRFCATMATSSVTRATKVTDALSCTGDRAAVPLLGGLVMITVGLPAGTTVICSVALTGFPDAGWYCSAMCATPAGPTSDTRKLLLTVLPLPMMAPCPLCGLPLAGVNVQDTFC